MLIKGTPCPNCDGYYFAVPYCAKCGWKDEEWYAEQLRICEEMRFAIEGFLTRGDKDV